MFARKVSTSTLANLKVLGSISGCSEVDCPAAVGFGLDRLSLDRFAVNKVMLELMEINWIQVDCTLEWSLTRR
jgi:hypothetical protein